MTVDVSGCGAPEQSAPIPASVDLEVVTSPAGQFRFFAAPGRWTLRALSRAGNGDATVDVGRGVNEVALTVAS